MANEGVLSRRSLKLSMDSKGNPQLPYYFDLRESFLSGFSTLFIKGAKGFAVSRGYWSVATYCL